VARRALTREHTFEAGFASEHPETASRLERKVSDRLAVPATAE
jgi:hypothetical protein